MATYLQVTAPVVIIRGVDGTQQYFYQDAFLTGGLDQEHVDQLLKEKQVTEVEVDDDAQDGVEVDGRDSAEASDKVSDVLARVGEDPTAAQAALDKENEKAEPRSTLVSKLEAIVEAS